MIKKIVFAYNTSAHQGVSSALGALSRRFYPVAPTRSKPIHTRELPRLAFYWGNLPAAKADRLRTNNFCELVFRHLI